MEIIYCARCGRAVPPGGVDDGQYHLSGGKAICMDCYNHLSEEEHTGGTVVKLQKVKRRSPTTRIGPAVKADQRTSGSKIAPAVRGSGAGRSSAHRTSARLRALGRRGSPAGAYLVGAVVLALLVGAAVALVVHLSRGG